ncbi:MAG: hypothetical protein OER21_09925 [Gemmatimonadota bacterium]|nr:hypothetical protein [Gemmatimonadota bacterium]
MFRKRLAWAALVGMLSVAACDSGSVIGPDNQLQVTNATDNFQLQASALDNVSQTLTYTWQNTGTSANINQSGTLTAGSATLTIEDDAGTQVYSRSLGETGTFQTTAGTAGVWTIRVVLSGMSGTLNFRAQKP